MEELLPGSGRPGWQSLGNDPLNNSVDQLEQPQPGLLPRLVRAQLHLGPRLASPPAPNAVRSLLCCAGLTPERGLFAELAFEFFPAASARRVGLDRRGTGSATSRATTIEVAPHSCGLELPN